MIRIPNTLVEKRNSSFLQLKILKEDAASCPTYKKKPKRQAFPVLHLVISKFANEEARSFFFFLTSVFY